MSGGSNPQTTTQESTVKLSPEQQQVFSLAMPYISQYANKAPETYAGKTTVDPSQATLDAQQAALASNSTTAGLANQAAATQGFLLNPAQLDPNTNPWLMKQGQAVTDTVTNNLLEKILPSIRAGDSMTGGVYSGGNTKAGISTGLAVGKTNADIANSLASLYGDAYKTGLTTMGTAVQNNPQVQMQQLFAPQVTSAVGSQQEGYEAAALTDQFNRWNLEQQLPYLKASDLLGLISGMPGATSVSTVKGYTPTTSPFMSGLGGAASGAALGSMIMPGVGTAAGAALGGLGGFFLR